VPTPPACTIAHFLPWYGTDGADCNCNPLNPYTWCSTINARNFIEVGVAENYAGAVGMCVKSVRQSNGTQYQGMACGYNAVAVRYTTYCNCGGYT